LKIDLKTIGFWLDIIWRSTRVFGDFGSLKYLENLTNLERIWRTWRNWKISVGRQKNGFKIGFLEIHGESDNSDILSSEFRRIWKIAERCETIEGSSDISIMYKCDSISQAPTFHDWQI
jgi:hypothetical protein